MKKWFMTRKNGAFPVETHPGEDAVRSQGQYWTVVLAGRKDLPDKRNTRFASEQHTFNGPHAFVSMPAQIRQVWNRAKQLCDAKRVVTILDNQYWDAVRRHLFQEQVGRFVWEPQNRGNLTSLFLVLSYIRFHDPHAIVYVWLTGHSLHPWGRVISYLKKAQALVRANPRKITLLTVPPPGGEEYDECDLLENGDEGENVIGVRHGMENRKPRGMKEENTPWYFKNERGQTSIMIGNVQTLWGVGHKFVPEILLPLSKLESFIGTPREQRVINDFYRWLPKRNLHAHLLSHLGIDLERVELQGVYGDGWVGSQHSPKISSLPSPVAVGVGQPGEVSYSTERLTLDKNSKHF